MKLMFWKASKPVLVTKAINSHLTSEFGLGSELLAKLRMLEKNGRFASRRVRMVRVFDPELVSTGEASELKYNDFNGNGNKEALRFEGRFEQNGTLFMSDRRPKATIPSVGTR